MNVVSHIGGHAQRPPGEAEVERLIRQLETASWFAALGEPPTEGEVAEARAYLAGLGRGGVALDWLADWQAAEAVSLAPDWDQDWWEAEQQAQKDLYGAAAAALGEKALLALLTRVTDAAGRLIHGPAAVAAARAGVADASIIRVAAGAGAQAAYQAALVSISGAAKDHFFSAKLRLYLAGRWPLVLHAGRFAIF